MDGRVGDSFMQHCVAYATLTPILNTSALVPLKHQNAIFYFHSLKLAGAAPSELHVYPRGGHGYGRCTESGADVGDEVCTWPDRGQLFLQTLDAAPNTTAPASTNVAIAPAPRNELVSIVGRPTPTGAVVNLWPTAVAPGDEGHPPLPAETLACLTPNVPVDKCIDQKIGDVSVPTITPYLVANASSAVIIAPGGAYAMLAVDREGTDIAAWANSIGVSAFVIKYRVPGRSWLPFGGAPLMDAQRAMGLVRQMAGEWFVLSLIRTGGQSGSQTDGSMVLNVCSQKCDGSVWGVEARIFPLGQVNSICFSISACVIMKCTT